MVYLRRWWSLVSACRLELGGLPQLFTVYVENPYGNSCRHSLKCHVS